MFSLFTQSYPNVITHILEPYHPNPNLKSLPLSRTHTQIYNTHPHPNLQHPPTPRSTTPTHTQIYNTHNNQIYNTLTLALALALTLTLTLALTLTLTVTLTPYRRYLPEPAELQYSRGVPDPR